MIRTTPDFVAMRRPRPLSAWLRGVAAALAGVLIGGGAMATTPGAPIDLSRHALVLDETFDTLDVSAWGPGTRWIAHTPWGGDFGDAVFTDPSDGFPFTTENGVLRIEARKEADGTWRSGLLASSDPSGAGFHLQYGYFEMRAKLPPGPGVWPAFWLIYNKGEKSSLEIDVLEYYGRQPDVYHSVVRVWPRDPADDFSKWHVGLVNPVPSGALSDDFHDYGVSVDPEWIVFYLDRREVSRAPTPAEHGGPMFILLNLALGSASPIDETPSPSFMYVDHVRAYAPPDP